jgi:hypothetical protein
VDRRQPIRRDDHVARPRHPVDLPRRHAVDGVDLAAHERRERGLVVVKDNFQNDAWAAGR